jgi:hypothetical protein
LGLPIQRIGQRVAHLVRITEFVVDLPHAEAVGAVGRGIIVRAFRIGQGVEAPGQIVVPDRDINLITADEAVLFKFNLNLSSVTISSSLTP